MEKPTPVAHKPGKLHLDGLRRDLERYRLEFWIIWQFIQPDLRRFRWRKPSKWSHLLTNLPVEAAKVAPWFIGHIVFLQAVANLGLIGALIWVLL